nr:MAG TPA: Soluble cytochrome cA c5, Protein stability, Shewanella [Caudoviricetes sp.]
MNVIQLKFCHCAICHHPTRAKNPKEHHATYLFYHLPHLWGKFRPR